jgi:hypothetical protein
VALCSERNVFVEFRIEDWKSLSEVYWEEEVAALGDTVTTCVATTMV